MRGLVRQNENHLGKVEDLARLPSKDEVAVVNRIERAAVDTGFFQRKSEEQILRATPSELFAR